MRLLLVVLAAVALTLLALALLGVAAAIGVGIVGLNVLVALLGSRAAGWRERARRAPSSSERWRPRSFARPPAPTQEHDERTPRLTIHRG